MLKLSRLKVKRGVGGEYVDRIELFSANLRRAIVFFFLSFKVGPCHFIVSLSYGSNLNCPLIKFENLSEAFSSQGYNVLLISLIVSVIIIVVFQNR